jgi:hypothetical protein
MKVTQKSSIADILLADGFNAHQTGIAERILLHLMKNGRSMGYVAYMHQSSSMSFALPFISAYKLRELFHEGKKGPIGCPERTAWYVMKKLEDLGYVQKGRDGRRRGYFLSLEALKRHRNIAGGIQRFLRPIMSKSED